MSQAPPTITVCYFGIYNPTHTRNRLNIKGLRQNGVTVLECNVRDRSWKKYWLLTKKYWSIRKLCDVIIVGFPGHPIMPLAWLLGRLTGKKIIFDAFISLYDSYVFDEKKYSPRSWPAKKYWLVDWLACKLADLVLLEVNEYGKYFVETFHLPGRKFRRVYVACDDEVIYPRDSQRKYADFRVHFHGTYIPAQGIEYILGAAKKLAPANIRFHLIGRLKTYAPAQALAQELGLTNVQFIDFMPYEQLAEYMAQSDVCLGMFGNTAKAERAGAFKIMEAMAMQKPLVTANTPAVREFLIDGQNALLCRLADADDLAEKILRLKNEPELRERLAENGYQLFKREMTPQAVGAELKKIISDH